MALDFPNSPTLGTTYLGPNGVVWSWDGAKWINGTVGTSTAYAPLNSPNFIGNPTAPNPVVGDNDTSVATTSFVQAATGTALNNVGRNLVMNPLFNVQQRGVGSWTGGGYTADRWTQYIGGGDTCSTALYPLSDADRTQIGDDVARWTLGLTFTGTATSTSQITLLQNIEDVRRTSGKTVTLSFWARNVSGSARVGIAWAQAFGTGGSPSASVNVNLGATPLLTASFTRYTFTVSLPSINGKTLGSNNDSYLGIQLFMSCAPSNANNGVAGGIGVQSGSANLWGVQLEVGSVATPLDYGGSPQQQLAQCQRFYVNGSVSLYSYNQAGAYVTQAISLPVPMRATPTVVPTLTPANLTGTTMDALNPYQVRCLGTATALGACNAIGTFTASADL